VYLKNGEGFMKIRDYIQLMKPSLSIMVVFSSVISYLLAPKVVEYDWLMILLLFVGGMLVTGSANAINQVVERDTDAQMKRTASRPIASGRLSPLNGWVFAILSGAVGVWILGNWFNWSAALLAAFSLFLYAFIYTPLKKVNSIAVLMGAVPGALPCLIGWVAGQDEFSLGGWILFAFQFFWQFPHFWAIAWVAHQDYAAVGFRLLPSREGPTQFTAMQTIAYSLLLVPVTLLPFFTGMSTYDSLQGLIAIGLVILANVFMIGRCINLYRTMEVKAARRVMFGSYLYLPLILFALLLSKATTA
jgi:protoheme IX farnesyltransferase